MSAKALVTRRERKENTRRALLDAARRCFAERGFGATGVGDIARAADVAHGTFYVHFPSKEAAADELVAEFNAELAEKLAPALASAATTGVPVAARAAARAFLALLERERALAGWYGERVAAGGGAEAFRAGINPPALALLSGALAAAAGREGPSSRDHLAAHGLLALWLRVGLQTLFGEGVSRREAEDVLALMTAGAVAALAAGKNTPR